VKPLALVLSLLSAAAGAAQQPAGAEPKKSDALHDLSATLETLSRRVNKSVVQIFASGYALGEDSEGRGKAAVVTRQRASGSGVIVSADGYIVTNGHVVSNARRVRVRMAEDGPTAGRSILQPAAKMLEARVIGVDRDTDLAVLKIDRTNLSSLPFGDSDTLQQGQLVMAFGNPLGLENSVSLGVVSSAARQLKPDDTMIYIQTDAPINPGNSGGPLVDADGHVMGINTFILSQSGGSEGLGFAIPSNIVRSVYTQIKQEGHVHRSEIGTVAQTITPALASGLRLSQDWGVLLSDVTPDGSAEKAGLEVGDMVLSLDGKPMQNARQFEINLYRSAPGQKVNIEVLRGTNKLTYPVTVVEREDDPQRFADMVDPAKNVIPKLGILGIGIDQKVVDLLPELRKKYGVVVAARAGDSPYTGDSLQLGDVIYSVNSLPVTSIDSLRTALDGLKDNEALVLQVQRGDRLIFLTMEIE
jgi:serine protease Do